jgi:hypothetical protein
MSRLSQLSSNPTLNGYVQGVGEQSVSAIADFIAPTVAVAKARGRFKKWGEKSLLTIPDTRRQVRGGATLVDFSLSDELYNCEPHALDFPMDIEEADETEDLINLVKEGALITGQLAALAHEKSVLDLASASATAGTELDSTSASADLVDIVDQQIGNVIKGAKGMGAMMEIRMVWGFDSMRKFKNHASVKDRFKVSGSKSPVNPKIEDIIGLFATKVNAQVSLLVLDTNTNLDAQAINFMFGSKLLVFAAMATPTRFDTSFMKTFRKMGRYMAPRYYTSADGRVEFTGYDWSEEVQVTNAGASRFCNVA